MCTVVRESDGGGAARGGEGKRGCDEVWRVCFVRSAHLLERRVFCTLRLESSPLWSVTASVVAAGFTAADVDRVASEWTCVAPASPARRDFAEASTWLDFSPPLDRKCLPQWSLAASATSWRHAVARTKSTSTRESIMRKKKRGLVIEIGLMKGGMIHPPCIRMDTDADAVPSGERKAVEHGHGHEGPQDDQVARSQGASLAASSHTKLRAPPPPPPTPRIRNPLPSLSLSSLPPPPAPLRLAAAHARCVCALAAAHALRAALFRLRPRRPAGLAPAHARREVSLEYDSPGGAELQTAALRRVRTATTGGAACATTDAACRRPTLHHSTFASPTFSYAT